jgi:hypothetical protein
MMDNDSSQVQHDTINNQGKPSLHGNSEHIRSESPLSSHHSTLSNSDVNVGHAANPSPPPSVQNVSEQPIERDHLIMSEPSVDQTLIETSKRPAEEGFQPRENGSIIPYASRSDPSPNLESGEDEFTPLVDSVPKQIYFILPEFLSFVDWCKKNRSVNDKKEIELIEELKKISEGVNLNMASDHDARESLINTRKMCREVISRFLNGTTHGNMLNIYNKISNIEIDGIKSDSRMSFSYMDCFMRIFFSTDQKELKELFYYFRESGNREPIKNISLNEERIISYRITHAMASASRQKILINGYKRLLSILQENKDFKDIIAPRIEEVENIIKKLGMFNDMMDFFSEIVMYVAGVSCPGQFQRYYETRFFYK